MHPGLATIVTGAFWLSFVSPTFASPSQGGHISVTVTDRSGAALPNAVVEIAGDRPPIARTTRDDGHCRLFNLPPGEYRLAVSKEGFTPASHAGLIVRIGETLSISVVLDIAGLEHAIEVTAPRGGDRPRVSFSRDDLERLPIARHAAALLPAAPGVVADRINIGGSESHQQPQFVFRGSRMLDTAWTIDGVVVSDRQTGSPFGFYDVDALDQVQFSTANSDIARMGGGLAVNMTVRSGTNEPRGAVRGYFAGEHLQASNRRDEVRALQPLATAATADRVRQVAEYGGEAGGPLWRGHAWYFAAAARQDVRVFRMAGGDERAVLTPRNLKVNWRPSQRDSVNLLWLDHGVTRFGVNPSAFRAPTTARQHQTTAHPDNPFHGLWKVEGQRMLRPTVFATARYAYLGTGFRNVSIGTGPAAVSPRLGESIGGTVSSLSLRPQHALAVDTSHFVDLRRSSHEVTWGFSWQRNDMINVSTWPGDGVVAFDISPADQRARVYRQQFGRNRLAFFGAYLSDTVSSGRFTVDLGVRLDHQTGQPLASSPAGNPAFPHLVPGIDFPGERHSRAWVDLSPRATLTYAAGRSGRTLLRGGIGRYASQLVMGVAAQQNPANVQAWIEYPWTDLNGDRLAQPDEVRVDLPYLAFDGLNPADPAAAVPQNSLDPDMRGRNTTSAFLAIQQEFRSELIGTLGYHYARHTNWPYLRWHGLTSDDYTLIRVLSDVLPDGTPVNVPLYAPDAEKIRVNGARRVFDSSDGYHSTYRGLEASLLKRLSHGWTARATAAWNDSRSFYSSPRPVNSMGNPTPLDGASGTGPLSAPADPLVSGGQVAPATMAAGGGGNVFLNARWQISVHAAVLLPKGFEFGGYLFGREGTPSPYVIPQRLGLDGVRSVLVTAKVDSVRLEHLWNLDVRFSKRFRYRRLAAQAVADVFNVLNGNAVLVRERNLRSVNFDRVNQTVPPRILRIGLRLSY